MKFISLSPTGPRQFIRAVLCSLLLVSLIAPTLLADEGAGNGQLADPFLDKLVGDWHVTRSFPSGRTAENTVHAQWTLNHQWLRLEYRDVATPSKYEATVFIGYDGGKKRYVCHWMDSFGGSYSVLGWGTLDEASQALEIDFTDGGAGGGGGGLTNRFTYDPKSNSWTSLIRQTENGQWKVFCEDKFVRAEGKK